MKAGRIDKPLFLALALGAFPGILLVIAYFPSLHHNLHSLFLGVFTCCDLGLACLIFPVFISLTARRFYFFWGFIPGLTMLTTLIAATMMYCFYQYHVVSIGGGSKFFFRFFLAMMVCALISSGPVSLVRYIIQRRRGAASMPADVPPVELAGKEGAWPPPPAVK